MGKKAGFMVLICVLGLFLSLFPMNVGGPITGTQPPTSGDWEISNETMVIDETVDIEGSIIVNNGGSLTLDNSTIKIKCGTDGEHGIEVKSGGAIYIKNGSVIDRYFTSAYYFIVRSGATFEMKNSTIYHCGYANLDDYRYSGLYLECDATIEYSTIDLCCQGVIAENETVTVRYTTVEHSYWHNIEGRNAHLILDHCTFNATSKKCNVEFYAGCTATCTNNVISNADHNNIWAKTDVVATIENNTIWGAKNNGIWADDNCDLTIKNNIVHNNTCCGLWINDSTVVCNGNTIRDNGKPGEDYWDESGHGFAGFHGDVTFKDNFVGYNYGHNFETTDCTTVFEDNTFHRSIMKCNVEFFEGSQVTAKNNYINGAGHNCFWMRDGVTALIEENTMMNSPHNGIWAGNDCTLTIKDNIIMNCTESGIYSYNSTLTIENNDIRNCSLWGIHTEGCSVTQSGNTFTDVAEGQIHLAYFMTIKAQDKDGNAVQGASITVKDSAGNEVCSHTTDANGETPCMIFSGQKVDTSGTSTTCTYTVEAEKGDMKDSSELTPDQSGTLTLSLESEGDGDEDGLDLMLIVIIIVVIVIVIVIVAMAAVKKRKK